MRKKLRKESKGITLIALVITIIVLLILAAVTISTLTGDNGILTKAGNAKTENKNAETEEQVKLAIMGSYGEDGKIDLDQLNKNLSKIDGYESGEITKLPATITVGGKNIEISSAGNVTIAGEKVTISEAQTAGTVFEKETILEDKYGNQIKIPEGFKIASDSATEVTKGIVIEDATYDGTIGSQFVWIPVGEVTGSVNGVEKTETIKLSRYTFEEDGTPTDQGTKSISPYSDYQELTESLLGNTVAKDVEKFITSANLNHGYYIGRYEARKSSEGNLTLSGTDTVYNNITQPEAARVSRNMYIRDEFTSDLMNSYAWDTAIVFEQEFDDRTDKTIPYSMQSSSNEGEIENAGTNNSEDLAKQDVICNIWDMASNCIYEWTTETSGDHRQFYCGPFVYRRTSYRENTSDSSYIGGENCSFRPLIYFL